MDACPFCTAQPPRVWIENDHAIVLSDAYPVADGHMLIAPWKHVNTIYELTISEQRAIRELVGKVRERFLTGLKQDGSNIGFDDGLAAGQTVLHAHVHIIPRRQGDVPAPRGGISSASSGINGHNVPQHFGSPKF